MQNEREIAAATALTAIPITPRRETAPGGVRVKPDFFSNKKQKED